ncbi:aminotransferase [Actinoplanes sp. SE50]|uniref:aminotransferase class I/II-fold pyridoxal phosphate-dependent enzyme n=1 Tax=unclassified Actinoplanes TaxID=2626549 RepID=UPI00023EC07B|nr:MULTISPECIES: aminotransferase class I/II-fold pyridoxal phosphate-dependent enzyme [unclassified Actinoplanes]AEV82973.1 aspartate aminotransferase [Actinoplanes sp. SE50/110]ATO81369.1 aminotransferase [Actinoplanes sp. SE50]SLL98776.1 aminotransferase [Actinoplanes sp. SE50/110]
MRLSQRALSAEPFHAMAFGRRAGELEAAGHDVVRLGLGEPDFGAPPAVREAMRRVMDGRPLPYTPAFGLPALRAAIAGFYRERHGVQVDPARIAVTPGASGALLLVAAATTDPGDEVIVADPSYPCNRQLVETFGGTVVTAATTPESRYQLDTAAVDAVWSERTRAVMVASPANPTGTSLPFADLVEVCARARARDAWRIVDEIYLDLADPAADGTPPRTILSADPDALVINSFSKYFGMTGWRLGWCVLPEALVPAAERLAMNYFLCASTPAQIAALECFTPESLAVCEQRRRELLARRAIALEGLAGIGLPVPVPPDGAFYVYFDVSGTGLGAWEFCRRALEEAFVSVTPGRDFAVATAESHVRLSYAASREALREGLARLSRFVQQLRRESAPGR